LGQAAKTGVDDYNSRGKGLLHAGKVEEAIVVWRQGFLQADSEQAPVLAKNLSIAHLKLKRPEQAHYYISFYLTMAGKDLPPDTLKKALISLDLIERDLVGREKITLTTTPADATVYVDGASPANRYRTPFAWRFAPGVHKLTIAREGMVTVEEEFTVEPGRSIELTVTLLPNAQLDVADSGAPGKHPPDNPVGIPKDPVVSRPVDRERTALPWVIVGGGVAVAAAGGIFEFLAYRRSGDLRDKYQGKIAAGMVFSDAQSELKRDFDSDVKPLNTAGVTLLVAGGSTITGGLIWALTESVSESATTGVRVGPIATPGATGAQIEVVF